jgi:hypothetical protein
LRGFVTIGGKDCLLRANEEGRSQRLVHEDMVIDDNEGFGYRP